jgi:hypothetical protein
MKRISMVCFVILATAVAGCGGSNKDEQDARSDLLPDPGEDLAESLLDVPDQDTPAETPGDSPADPPADSPADTPADEPVEDGTDAVDAPGCEEGCMSGLSCCDDRCVNPLHDPAHCSGCGSACTNATPFCDSGTCTVRPCEVECIGTMFCCGGNCCDLDQICCQVDGPGPGIGPACYDGFCPGGCPMCV